MREKKNGWRALGYFCLSWTPMLAYLAIMWGVAIVFGFIMGVVAMVQGEENFLDYVMQQTMTIGACYAVLGIIALGLWYYFGCKRKKLLPPKGVLTPGTLGIIVLLALVMQYVSSYIMMLIGALLPDAMENYIKMIEMSGLETLTFTTILYGVILGPIAEELVFRGLTMFYAQRFTKRFWLANLVQAVAFGIMHLNIVQGIYAAVLGLVFGWVYHRTRSLYSTIWFHIVFNFLGIGVLEYVNQYLPESVGFLIIFGIIVAAATVALLLAFNRRTSQAAEVQGQIDTTEKEGLPQE